VKNFELPFVPERPSKPRNKGITMMMDKGLSIRETEDFIEKAGELTDLVKLGFGTSYVTNNLQDKINLYKEANLKVYLGGTLFEAFALRGMIDDYKRVLDKYKLEYCEVSDGSLTIEHGKKCEFISDLAKDYTVLSEVGSKEADFYISPDKWVHMMNTELDAGSWQVIAEAREGGNVGIYNASGGVHTDLIGQILKNVPNDSILWEAPIKSQQVWFIKLLGPNVNVGNIAPHEVIPLETLRLGLRGDTFFNYIPDNVAREIK
jgi:phosphosulfolactate synthase